MEKDTSQVFREHGIYKLIDFALETRFKAYITASWEAGLRVEECLGLIKKEIVKEKTGWRLHVDGKTGKRQPLIVDEKGWLEERMKQVKNWSDDKFIFSENGKVPCYRSYIKMLKRTAVRAGFKDKPIYPHLLRHSRITHCAKLGWSESQLNAFFGWEHGSDMAGTYIHMDARSCDNKVLEVPKSELETPSPKKLEAVLIDMLKHKTEFKQIIKEMIQDES